MYRVYKYYYLLKSKASGYIAPQCREIFLTFVTKLPHTIQTSVNFEILRRYTFVGFVQITLKRLKPGKFTHFKRLGPKSD